MAKKKRKSIPDSIQVRIDSETYEKLSAASQANEYRPTIGQLIAKLVRSYGHTLTSDNRPG